MDTQTSPTYVDGPVTKDQLEAGVWARAEHVAIAVGVDARTIRRRVHSGTLERGQFAGRAYVRQAPRPAVQAAPDSAGHTSSTAHLEALALVVREQLTRAEHLATELGHARATVEQLEHVRQAERRALELELANVRQVVTSAEAQLATVRQDAELSTARSARLEALARAPWYAVRVRRRLRRELASA